MSIYAENLRLERIEGIKAEIKRLQGELKQLEQQRGDKFQTILSVVDKDDALQRERIATLEGQNFLPPTKLASQLGWKKHDLLLFSLDKNHNLTIQKPNLSESGYTMILEDTLRSVVPTEILQIIYPNLCQDEFWMLPTTEFYTQIKGHSLLIRHK